MTATGKLTVNETLQKIIESCRHESGWTKIDTIRSLAEAALAESGAGPAPCGHDTDVPCSVCDELKRIGGPQPAAAKEKKVPMQDIDPPPQCKYCNEFSPKHLPGCLASAKAGETSGEWDARAWMDATYPGWQKNAPTYPEQLLPLVGAAYAAGRSASGAQRVDNDDK